MRVRWCVRAGVSQVLVIAWMTVYDHHRVPGERASVPGERASVPGGVPGCQAALDR